MAIVCTMSIIMHKIVLMKRDLVMTVGKYMLHFMHDWGHRVHDGCVAVPIKAIAYHFYILQSSISHTFTKLSTHTLIVLILNIIFTIFFVWANYVVGNGTKVKPDFCHNYFICTWNTFCCHLPNIKVSFCCIYGKYLKLKSYKVVPERAFDFQILNRYPEILENLVRRNWTKVNFMLK